MATASEKSTLQANGINIHYQVSGEGEPLLLLHGGTATLQSWTEHLPVLTPHFKVYALDSRAHGKTDNPAGTLRYPQMADDVAAFIEALNLDHPIVMGYSDGGQIALELGMRYHGVARALVLGGTFYEMTPAYLENLHAVGLVAPGEVDFAAFEQINSGWVEYLKQDHVREADPDYWKKLMIQISGLWLTPIAYSAAELQRVDLPTLVAIGDRDEAVALDQGIGLYRMLPNGELLVFPNATHEGAFTQLSNSLVLDFLLKQRIGA